jgi:hypothetical protein
MSLYTKIKLFSKIRSVMNAISTIPSVGEPLFYSDLNSLKIGDGVNLPSAQDFLRTETIQNHVLDSDFSIAQRGTSFTSGTIPANNDDTYLFDRWVLLSDGNDVVNVSQSNITDKTWCKSVVQTINKQWGYLYILPAEETLLLNNKKISLSFRANTTTAKIINNLKVAVLSWTGTADSVTSDVVATWGATPTWAASWTLENTLTNIPITTTDTTYYVENVAIDTASVKNVAIFIWVNDVDAASGDELFLTDVMCNIGQSVFPYRPYHKGKLQEYQACQEFLFELKDFVVCPNAIASYLTTGTASVDIMLPFRLRTTPTITTLNIDNYLPLPTSAAVAVGTLTISGSALKGTNGVYFVLNDTGKFSSTAKYLINASGGNGKISFNMEL